MQWSSLVRQSERITVDPASLEKDRLHLKNMSAFDAVLSVMVDLWVHTDIFCSGLELKTWFKLLIEEIEILLKLIKKVNDLISDDYIINRKMD